MSLELKIEKLTDAIERLIAAMQPQQQQPALTVAALAEVATEIKKVTKTRAEVIKPQAPSIESLQSRCMEISRKTPASKPKIKSLIAGFGGAKLVEDIPEDNRAEFAKLLEGLS